MGARRSLWALTLALLVVLPLPAGARASLPPQGVYEACYPGLDSAGCAARVKLAGGAGFRVVVNYWMLRDSTASQVLSYVDAARAAGVQVLWPLGDWWSADPAASDTLASHPKLAATCDCSTNLGLVRYLVGLARSSAGTWGYYIADEPNASERGRLAAFSATVRSLDPGHPQLLVACGVCAGAGADPTGSAAGPFAGIDAMLALDQYPVFTQPPNPSLAGNWVAAGARGLQRVADAAGRDSALVLQAFSWGMDPMDAGGCGSSARNCRYPTEAELAAERDAALRGGRPRLILWYALFGTIGALPAQQPSDWTAPDDPARRWHDLVAAAFAPLPLASHAALTAEHPIRGRRVLGRLRLRGAADAGFAWVELRSSALRLHPGRRYLLRSCITGHRLRRCRSRWYRAGRRRPSARAPRLRVRLAGAFTGEVTVELLGRHRHIAPIASSKLRGSVSSAGTLVFSGS